MLNNLWRRAWLLALPALAAAATAAPPKLTSVVTEPIGEGLKVEIGGEGLANPNVLRVIGNTSYIVEFDGVLGTPKDEVAVGYAGVQYVEWVQFSARPPKVRVHLKLDPSLQPVLESENGTWVVKVNVAEEAVAEEVPALTEDEAAMAGALGQLGLDVPAPIVPANPAAIITEHPLASPVVEVEMETTPMVVARQDSFPEIVPPIETTSAPALIMPPYQPGLVTLDFSGTDIIQILKALSIQAGVNIVASPDVSPESAPVKLTLTLENVTVEDALSFITAISGLRYTKIGNTFVVARTVAGDSGLPNFSQAVGQISLDGDYESRVVQVKSRQPEAIKNILMASNPPGGKLGYYEIILASVTSPKVTTVKSGAETSTAPEGEEGTTAASPTTETTEAVQTVTTFLTVVAMPGKINDVIAEVNRLDEEILGDAEDRMIGTVAVPVYSGETARIQTMLTSFLATNPRGAEFSIQESSLSELPVGESPTKLLLMIGPAKELASIEQFVSELDRQLCGVVGIEVPDTTAGAERVYEVVNLKFIEPFEARTDLVGRVRGLYVSTVPSKVTPGLEGTEERALEDVATTPTEGETQEEDIEQKRGVGAIPMMLVLRGTPAQIAEAKEYLALIDVAPRQIALELRVLEITKEDALRLGISWDLLTGGRATTIGFNQLIPDSNGNPNTVDANNIGFTDGGDLLGVTATLDRLANDRNLIARPNALISDGRSANLFVGDTVRYVKTIQSSQNGVTVQTDEIQVGVTFDIAARVGGDGEIALNLNQNFSLLTGFTPVPGGGQLPQTSDRKTNLFVNMKSGETIAIGGLIQEQDVKRVSGVPILMDLPIIGYLFKRTQNSKVRTEIVFFLTARTVTADDRANAASPRMSEMAVPDPKGVYKETGGQP